MVKRILLTVLPALLAVFLFLAFPEHSGPELRVVNVWASAIGDRDGSHFSNGAIVALSNEFGRALVSEPGGVIDWAAPGRFIGASATWAVNYSSGEGRPRVLSLTSGREYTIPEPYLPWPVANWIVGLLPDRSGLVLADSASFPVFTREYRWVAPITQIAGDERVVAVGLADGRLQVFFAASSGGVLEGLSFEGSNPELQVFHREFSYFEVSELAAAGQVAPSSGRAGAAAVAGDEVGSGTGTGTGTGNGTGTGTGNGAGRSSDAGRSAGTGGNSRAGQASSSPAGIADRVVAGLAVSELHIAVLYGARNQTLVILDNELNIDNEYRLESPGIGRVVDLKLQEFEQGYLLLRVQREHSSFWLRISPSGELEEFAGQDSVFAAVPARLPQLGLGLELVRAGRSGRLRFFGELDPARSIFGAAMRPGDFEVRGDSVFWLADASAGEFTFEWVQ